MLFFLFKIIKHHSKSHAQRNTKLKTFCFKIKCFIMENDGPCMFGVRVLQYPAQNAIKNVKPL